MTGVFNIKLVFTTVSGLDCGLTLFVQMEAYGSCQICTRKSGSSLISCSQDGVSLVQKTCYLRLYKEKVGTCTYTTTGAHDSTRGSSGWVGRGRPGSQVTRCWEPNRRSYLTDYGDR